METIPQSEKTPSRRLITQNVLTSAAQFESTEELDWLSVQDLCAFIDLFCLYDSAIVIGRGGEHTINDWSSDFFSLLRDTNFVKVEYPSNQTVDSVATTAANHLAAFLGEQDTSRFAPLFEHALISQAYRLEQQPDKEREIIIGREWLLTAPTHASLLKQLEKEQQYETRGTTFLIRTFLYLAYANVNEIAFTPDAVRCPVLATVLDEEEQFRGRLLSKIHSSWESTSPGSKALLNRISPFAAIVFMRSGKDKRRIVSQMAELRAELEDTRKVLRDIEDKALWRSRADALKAQTEWNKAVDEVARSFDVANPLEVTGRFALDLAGEIGEVIEKPKSPSPWGKIAALPLHLVNRIRARGTLIGVHRLLANQKLPGVEKLRNSIYHLFGSIQE